MVASIEQRLSRVISLPAERAEGLQVLRYEKGQAFDAHYDCFTQDYLDRHPHTQQRLATVIMYLCALCSNTPCGPDMVHLHAHIDACRIKSLKKADRVLWDTRY